MDLIGAIGLFVSRTLWKLGFRSAGKSLVHALGSRDENLRTISGMFLVKGGKQAIPLLRDALVQRESLPMVLTLLGDLRAAELTPLIRPMVDDDDPSVARAAQETLRLLES